MRKQFLLSCALVLACLFPIMGNQDTQATVALGNPDPYQFPCATGFIRIVPHFCSRVPATSNITLVGDNTCRSIDLTAVIPTQAQSVLFSYQMALVSQNAIGNVTMQTMTYTDNTCATLFSNHAATIREFVATAGATLMDNRFSFVLWPVVNQRVYYKLQYTGTGHGGDVFLLGYYD